MRELPKSLLDALPKMCRASIDVVECTLRSGAAPVTTSVRDELLAKIEGGEYVELELDITAYEQKPGDQNRNYVRFRDGAMVALGRSGVGKPFLRDHNQWDSMSVAGTILASATEKRGEGDYVIRQTVRLTATWAVELALRGLLKFVSIGWRPTGPVMCSVCDAPIFDDCWHYPGQKLKNEDGEPTGVVVEWVYTAAELVETSSVPVPGVTTAMIDEIRAALSADEAFPGFRAELAQERTNSMKNFPQLLALLGLAATAGETDALSAVETALKERDALKAEIKIANQELAVANKELSVLSSEKKKTAEDKFISDALASGRITKGEEPEWREFYALSSDRATKRMGEKAEGSATPVGLKRQSDEVVADDKAKAAAAGEKWPATDVRTVLQENGINPDVALKFAKQMGCTDPVKAIANAIEKGA